MDAPRDLVLLVWRHAEVRAGHGLDVFGPLPAGLDGDPTHLCASGQVDQLESPVPTLTDLVGPLERLVLQRLGHDAPPGSSSVPQLVMLRVATQVKLRAGARKVAEHDARRTCATLLVDLDVHPESSGRSAGT